MISIAMVISVMGGFRRRESSGTTGPSRESELGVESGLGTANCTGDLAKCGGNIGEVPDEPLVSEASDESLVTPPGLSGWPDIADLPDTKWVLGLLALAFSSLDVWTA
jgi:hypothetical protein